MKNIGVVEGFRYIIHIYRVSGDHRTHFSNNYRYAVNFCNKVFTPTGDVYKIKLWDMQKGEIEPGNPDAKALVKTWI